jgi:sugar phosphate isomerase/epimerase
MRIALAGWSLHRRFGRPDNPLRLLDYPAGAREEFGIDKIELNSVFFEYEDPADLTSPFREGFLADLRQRAQDAGVQFVNITVDRIGDLAALDDALRRQAVERHRRWFDVCIELGCPAFRANSGGKDPVITDEHQARCTESFRRLADWAEESGITVLMENHGGLSGDPDRMIQIHKEVNSRSFGLLADFRNFPPPVDPHEALAKLAPHASFVHAKFLSFNAAGEDPDFDTARVMRSFRDAGYEGLFGIEFEGEIDDHEGVIKSRALLERYAY